MLDPIVQYAGDPKIPAKCLLLIEAIRHHGYDAVMHWAVSHGYTSQTIQSIITACKLR